VGCDEADSFASSAMGAAASATFRGPFVAGAAAMGGGARGAGPGGLTLATDTLSLVGAGDADADETPHPYVTAVLSRLPRLVALMRAPPAPPEPAPRPPCGTQRLGLVALLHVVARTRYERALERALAETDLAGALVVCWPMLPSLPPPSTLRRPVTGSGRALAPAGGLPR